MKITQNTMVPLSFIAVIAGSIFWLAVLSTDLRSAQKDIEKLEKIIGTTNTELKILREKSYKNHLEISRKLAKIEGKIDFLVDRLNNRPADSRR